jgi:hypothetical protein
MAAIGKECASEMVASDLMKSLRFIASSGPGLCQLPGFVHAIESVLAGLCAYVAIVSVSATILAGISFLSADSMEYVALRLHRTNHSLSALDTGASAVIECVTARGKMNSPSRISGQGSAVAMSASTGKVKMSNREEINAPCFYESRRQHILLR